MIEFDVSYLMQKTGPEPEIILFIAHQDEQQAMKELGLMLERICRQSVKSYKN